MRPNPRRRRGWSLLELLAVLTVVATLMTSAAGRVFQMLKIDGSARSRVVATGNLERLGRDLRADAHDATGPPDIGPDRVVLTRDDGRTAEYVVARRDVQRTVKKGGKVEHREGYRLPSAVAGRFEASRDGSRSVIAFVLNAITPEKNARPADPGYRDYRIEAVAGRKTRDLAGGGR